MWLLSAALFLPPLVFIISPATYTGEVYGLTYLILPWGEKLAWADLGSIWFDVVQLIRFVSLVYIIIALIIQYRHGERKQAIILGLGLLPFVIGILYEVFGATGFVPFIPSGELGFIGIAIAASLQLAISVIETEESLELHRNHLEELINERTQELEKATAALQQSERQTRALLDAPPDTAMLVTPQGDILATNQIGASRLEQLPSRPMVSHTSNHSQYRHRQALRGYPNVYPWGAGYPRRRGGIRQLAGSSQHRKSAASRLLSQPFPRRVQTRLRSLGRIRPA